MTDATIRSLLPPDSDSKGPNTRDFTPEDGESFRSVLNKLNGGGMSRAGLTTLDFGASPGASDSSIAVTGQTDILAGSVAEAWIVAATTTDHSADEHIANPPRITVGNVVAGTGFTIYGVNQDGLYGPSINAGNTLTYGKWSVMWRWQ